MKGGLKFLEEKIFKGLMILSIGIIVLSIVVIVASIILKGLPSMSLEMITQTPKGGFYLGKEGGILNAITGSFYLASGATLLSLVISIPVVIYLNIYAKPGSGLARNTRLTLDVLWGVPSIVFGAFGFLIMVFLGLKSSLLAGIITV